MTIYSKSPALDGDYLPGLAICGEPGEFAAIKDPG